MSDKFDKVLKRADEFISAKLNDQVDAFGSLVKLEKALKSEIELSILSIKRYVSFKEGIKGDFTNSILVTSFIGSEKRHCSEIYKNIQDSKSPVNLKLIDRCYYYAKLIESFDPKHTIVNTFNWVGADEVINRKEILRLYNGLRGLNSKQSFLISSDTSKSDFHSLMTGGAISEPIQWTKTKNSFIYFIDELATTYLNLPNSVENKFTEDPDKTKALMNWLNPKIHDCFKDQKGSKFEAKQLTTLRSKLNTSNLTHKDTIDEIISKIRLD